MSLMPHRTQYAGSLSGAPAEAPRVRLDVQTIETGTYQAAFDDGATMRIDLKRRETLPGGGMRLVAQIDGIRHELWLTRTGSSTLTIDYAGIHREIALQDKARIGTRGGMKPAMHGSITSPMPARVAEILVGPSDLVDEGAPLLRLEAMKMVITLPSPRRCRIETVHVSANESVEAGALLLSLTDADRP